jgi:hypothetical protein
LAGLKLFVITEFDCINFKRKDRDRETDGYRDRWIQRQLDTEMDRYRDRQTQR